LKVGAGPLSADELRTGIRRTRASLQAFSSANQIKPLYGISNDNTLGAGKTIAIVDAFGASTAEADLQEFSRRNGLPAITSDNFEKLDQKGGTNYPKDDTTKSGGWSLETALDVQSVHLFAPGAKIVLVVCNSADLNDLMEGVQIAQQKADYISMSWGSQEGDWISQFESQFNSPTDSFFASTGDDGFAGGVSYPASSQYVVAVGGTSLYTNPDFSLSSEQGWPGSGGGCSAYTQALPGQVATAGYSSLGCNNNKALPDVSSLADPSSGIPIVLSQSDQCDSPPCFFIVGGTSLAAPLTAARAAIRGAQVTPAYIYSSNPPIVFRDVTEGNNGGKDCQNGLDLVTGRGSWIGSL